MDPIEMLAAGIKLVDEMLDEDVLEPDLAHRYGLACDFPHHVGENHRGNPEQGIGA